MNTEINNLTAERSLEIITKAIESNRKELVRNAGRPMIVWGVLVMATSLICWWAMSHGNNGWIYLSWFVMALLGFAANMICDKQEHKTRVTDVVTRTVNAIWLSFCIFALGLGIFVTVLNLADDTFVPAIFLVMLAPMIALLMSMACVITGFVLKSSVITACGLLGALGTMLAIYLNIDDTCMLIMAVLGGIELLLPGIILNIKSRKE